MRHSPKYRNVIKKTIIISLSGCLLILYAGRYNTASADPVITDKELLIPAAVQSAAGSADSFIMHATARWHSVLNQISESIPRISAEEGEEQEHIPSVLRYNLVSLFPEKDEIEMDSINNSSIIVNPGKMIDLFLNQLYKRLDLPIRSKVNNSYGGQMYEFLNRKDAEWTSDLYQWIQATPERAAAMKSMPVSSVTGNYNPQNLLHKKEDPSTWLIPSWKNVTIEFYDGDGKKVDLHSNTQDILSMASVRTFYTGWQDTDSFKSYIDQLWNSSHSYSTSISDVYFCDGCEVLTPVTTDAPNLPVNAALDPQADISSGNGIEGLKTAPVASPSSATPAVERPQNEISTSAAEPSAEKLPPESDSAATTSASQKTSLQEGSSQKISSQVNSTQGIPAETDLANKSEAEESTAHSSEIHVNADGKFCPGHVDLIINAKIIGLSETKNLFKLDKNASMTWTPYMKAYTYQLFSQNWKKEYGLSNMTLGIGKPLTASEISEYMGLLPPDTSPKRRAVIAYALNSVGKIPYYYGGKPITTGYENNHFSSPGIPDQKGRILSGLDCSGWINWVYWSAIEERVSSLGTSGLIHEGRGISKADLKPGDILVKPGLNSHVVMFLAWAPDGSIICIHETGGSTNNVIVSTSSSSWPYYRAILD